MGALKVLIVEDEPLAREVLENYVGRTPGLEIAASCKHALEAFSILSKQHIDLLLLDINMPEINGIELLKALKNPPATIFTTAYSEFAVASYDHNAIDYLIKPIPFERFLKAIDKLVKTLNAGAGTGSNTAPMSYADPDILFVKSEGKLIRINMLELLFVEGLKDYLKLWTKTGRFIIHGTMKNMEEQLSKKPDFLRVNKSYLINMRYIDEVDGSDIKIGEHTIPIGNTYRDEVQEILNRLKLL
jgi:DNA-binding LytR/AlgR family response regulator